MKDENKREKTLSAYLSSKEKQPPYPDYFLSQLHSLIHQRLTEAERNKWSRNIERIEAYLHESVDKSNTRTLVFFTSGKGFWQVLRFEFFIEPTCKIFRGSYLKPLEEIVDKYEKYLVLLVDRKKAKLFTVHLGKVEERKDVFGGDVPQNVKAKKIDYGREDIIFRHIEQHLHRHLQIIAKKTQEFIKGKNIHFIILGGHEEMIPKVRKHLLYPLNNMVKGEFVTELNIPLNQLLLHSKKVALEIYTNQI